MARQGTLTEGGGSVQMTSMYLIKALGTLTEGEGSVRITSLYLTREYMIR